MKTGICQKCQILKQHNQQKEKKKINLNLSSFYFVIFREELSGMFSFILVFLLTCWCIIFSVSFEYMISELCILLYKFRLYFISVKHRSSPPPFASYPALVNGRYTMMIHCFKCFFIRSIYLKIFIFCIPTLLSIY